MTGTWKLEADSYWVTGITGRPVAQEVRNLVRGCEEMLKIMPGAYRFRGEESE